MAGNIDGFAKRQSECNICFFAKQAQMGSDNFDQQLNLSFFAECHHTEPFMRCR
jgi:hypothetical protein